MFRILFLLTISLLFVSTANARGAYQDPAAFVSESFDGSAPEPKILWLDSKLKTQVERILQHKYRGLRIRYWLKAGRSVWVLEEIGKDKPITTGIVITNNKIHRIKVLIFRESRGWEVKQAFFTQQFLHARLTRNNELDRSIDGITGATLSVRALTKVARIALLLHKKVTT